MPVGSASRVSLVESECANIGGNSVPFKTSVKYLGVHLDQTLSMQQHINSVCRTSFLELQWAASDCISPKEPLQDLSQQWSFLVLIIVTQSSQVYQQTKSLSYSESRTMRHGLLCKKEKENEITLHLSSKNFTDYPWNFAASIRLRLWPIAILKVFTPYLTSSLCTYEPSRSLRSSKEKFFRGTFF